EYMVPTAYVAVEKFPMTPNGKIDRKLLPAPNGDTLENRDRHVAPRDPMEQTLAAIWSKVLGVDDVGVYDDFFELGGHSLAAVKLLAELNKQTGRTLPLATFFQASTIDAFVKILQKSPSQSEGASLVPIQPKGTRNPLFLVHGAEGNVLLYRPMIRYLSPDQPV